MNGYVNFALLGRVFGYSLVAGVLLTGAFAVGARSLAQAEGARDSARPATLYYTLAAGCFALAAAGVCAGLWFVLDK